LTPALNKKEPPFKKLYQKQQKGREVRKGVVEVGPGRGEGDGISLVLEEG